MGLSIACRACRIHLKPALGTLSSFFTSSSASLVCPHVGDGRTQKHEILHTGRFKVVASHMTEQADVQIMLLC
jgi:hypothetical protein